MRCTPMQIAITAVTILLLCAVFLVGSLISERSEEWSVAIDPELEYSAALRKSFYLGGKFIQVGALIWAVMNVLALLHAAPRL